MLPGVLNVYVRVDRSPRICEKSGQTDSSRKSAI